MGPHPRREHRERRRWRRSRRDDAARRPPPPEGELWLAPIEDPPPAAGPAPEVLLVGTCGALGPGIAFVARDRYRCRPCAAGDTEGGDIVVVPPCRPEEIARLRARHPAAGIMVVDRRDSAQPSLAARCLSAGADAFVRGGQAALVVAYLDTLARRLPGPVG